MLCLSARPSLKEAAGTELEATPSRWNTLEHKKARVGHFSWAEKAHARRNLMPRIPRKHLVVEI